MIVRKPVPPRPSPAGSAAPKIRERQENVEPRIANSHAWQETVDGSDFQLHSKTQENVGKPEIDEIVQKASISESMTEQTETYGGSIFENTENLNLLLETTGLDDARQGHSVLKTSIHRHHAIETSCWETSTMTYVEQKTSDMSDKDRGLHTSHRDNAIESYKAGDWSAAVKHLGQGQKRLARGKNLLNMLSGNSSRNIYSEFVAIVEADIIILMELDAVEKTKEVIDRLHEHDLDVSDDCRARWLRILQKRVDNALYDERGDIALFYIQCIFDTSSPSEELYYQKAKALLLQQKPNETLEILATMSQLFSIPIEMGSRKMHLEAVTYWQLGRLEDALRCCEKAVRSRRELSTVDYHESLTLMVNLLEASGDDLDAEACRRFYLQRLRLKSRYLWLKLRIRKLLLSSKLFKNLTQ